MQRQRHRNPRSARRRPARTWTLFPLTALLIFANQVAAALPALETDLGRVSQEVRDPKVFNTRSCAPYLQERTRVLFERGAETYLPRNATEQQALAHATTRLTQALFDFRITLTDRLKDLSRHGEPDPACVRAVIRTLRHARFVEELLAEWYLDRTPAGGPFPVLDGPRPFLMIPPGHSGYSPRSGDILLARNDSFVSATIARISDEEGQFSHAALVHVDQGGEVWVLESLIKGGVVATPWEQWIAHPPVRVLVKRHRDPTAGAQAADWLHRWIARRTESGAAPAPYDFLMNFADASEFSCSELVQFAFRESSDGKIQVPRFASSLGELAKQRFIQVLGIRQPAIYSPSDFEPDPDLVTVAEWRDYARTARTRLQDAILTSLFHWMTEQGYELTYQGLTQGLGNLYWEVLRPAGIGTGAAPANMTRGFFQNMLALRSVTRGLEQHLAGQDRRHRQATGWGLDYKAMLSSLEELRRRDCADFLARRDEVQADPFLSNQTSGTPPSLVFHQYLNVPEQIGDCLDQ